MENQLIDVVCEDGSIQLCKIVKENETTYDVNFLEFLGGIKYNFSKEIETIEKETACGYYDTDNIEATGMYRRNDFGSYDLIEDDSDEDYEESEEDSESEDESLIDSEEEEENDIEC